MKMKEEQFRLIQAQIKRLMGQGGFYSKKFAGIDPDSIQSQEDFEKLPFTWRGFAGCLSTGVAGRTG